MLVVMVRENTSGHDACVTGFTEYGSVSSRNHYRIDTVQVQSPNHKRDDTTIPTETRDRRIDREEEQRRIRNIKGPEQYHTTKSQHAKLGDGGTDNNVLTLGGIQL